jgi:hypothetical protein
MQTSRCLPIFAIAILLGHPVASVAQNRAPRFEAGAQVSTLHQSSFDNTSVGLGGRFTYNLAHWAAVEAEGIFTPADNVKVGIGLPDFELSYERRRLEMFFGPKLGMRGDKFGVFGRVRPGFTQLSNRGVGCAGTFCALALIALPEYRTELAVDIGGGVEFFPSRRTVARLDLGDTVIRHRSQAPPCRECTSHNFASRLGFGFRF